MDCDGRQMFIKNVYKWILCDLRIVFVADRRFMPSVQRNSASLISMSSPGEFENILISNFGQYYLKGQVKGYTTQKFTLEYLKNILDDQQDADSDEKKQDTDADEEKQDTDEQVKKRVDYDLLGESIVSKILTSSVYTAKATNNTIS